MVLFQVVATLPVFRPALEPTEPHTLCITSVNFPGSKAVGA